MNNVDDFPADEHDEGLLSAIDLLRNIKPQAASRTRNRQVIATELARLNLAAVPVPWWGRSISVPVPIALGVGAVVLALALVRLPAVWIDANNQGSHTSRTEIEGRGSRQSIEAALAVSHSETPQIQYEASETFLCGIGRIRYESLYHSQED